MKSQTKAYNVSYPQVCKGIITFLFVICFLSVNVLAEEAVFGFGDSVKVNVLPANNTNNNTFTNNVVNIINRFTITSFYSDGKNNSAEILNATPEEIQNEEIITSNESAATETSSDSGDSPILTIFLFIVIILIGAGLIFGGFKIFSMFRSARSEPTPNPDSFEQVLISRKIKERLLEYKDKRWSWDDFMERVLKLIEKDANEKE